MRVAFILSAMMLVSGASSASTGWDRYEPILARSPFGQAAVMEEVKAPVSVQAAQLTKLYRLCAIYEGVDGLPRAGVVNRTNNKSTSLMQGESEEGLKLLDVRFETGEALLSSGGEQVWLKLQSVAFSGTPVNIAPVAGSVKTEVSSGKSQSGATRRTTARRKPVASRARLIRKPKPTANPGGFGGSNSGSNGASDSVRAVTSISDGAGSSSTSGNYSIRTLSAYEQSKFKGRL